LVPNLEATRELCGLGGSVKVGDAANGAGETGNASALKDIPDAVADLLLSGHDVIIAPRVGQTA
jgi:hypothetical protein